MQRRIDWEALPETVRAGVEARTGPVLKAETAAAGRNSAVAAFLHTLDDTIFVKGLRADHPGVVTQQREAMINPYVCRVAPRLLWQFETGGWNLLGFEYVEGRHADYTPGSEDLPLVVEVMRWLGDIRCPDVPVKQAEQRWAAYVDNSSALALLRGDTLLHTDFNPLNVLIGDAGARLIDWAWPTRGAAWIDPAVLVFRLINAGHPPADAERWAQQTPAWHTASEDALDTFALANSRLWEQIVHDDPQPWKHTMATAARRWAQHRLEN